MRIKIPLFDLNFNNKEENAVIKTLRSRWISMGPNTELLEKKFSELFGIRFSLATSSCTAALHLALLSIGIKPGDEIICPSLTFVATVNSIRYLNAVPVFCDIKNVCDLNINPDEIDKLITPKTKAIMLMHYGGFACDLDEIMRVAKAHKLKVIEDACHGPLSEYNGKKLGTIGDIGCFSFFSNKNISTGEGGMLVTNNENFYKKSKLLRSHGMTSLSYERSKGHSTLYDVIELGYNYRIDDIRASIGIVQLDKLKIDLEKREKVRQNYIKYLSGIKDVDIPFKDYHYFTSNYIFPVVLKKEIKIERDYIRNELLKAGIQTSVHYPAVHRFNIYKKFYRKLPNTDYVSDNLISFPMYSSLSKDKIKFVVQKFKNILYNV